MSQNLIGLSAKSHEKVMKANDLKTDPLLVFLEKSMKNITFSGQSRRRYGIDLETQPAIPVLPAIPVIPSPSGRDPTTHPHARVGG